MSKYTSAGYPDLKPYPASEAAQKAMESELSRLAIAAGGASGVSVSYLANGEVFVKALHKEYPHSNVCGGYGHALATLLNKAKPRCGEVHYGRNAVMIDTSGWCWVLEGLLVKALQSAEGDES